MNEKMKTNEFTKQTTKTARKIILTFIKWVYAIICIKFLMPLFFCNRFTQNCILMHKIKGFFLKFCSHLLAEYKLPVIGLRVVKSLSGKGTIYRHDSRAHSLICRVVSVSAKECHCGYLPRFSCASRKLEGI